ncbi:pyruvate kinase alpha/beta domain-containing protein [Chloroflexota bacterium]
MEAKIVYFDRPGQENTDEVLRIARERAKELGIKTVLVASTRGETAVKAVEALSGLRVVIVTHSFGFSAPNTQTFTEENRKIVESKKGIMLTATHAFAGVSRGMRNKTNTTAIGDLVAQVLRALGDGMKVVIEIAMMAADAGLVRTDEEVIAVAGTGKGADTAVVLNPVTSQNFLDVKVKEILCKPRF